MKSHFVIDGNAFYEVDDECMRRKKESPKEDRRQEKKQSKQRTDEKKGVNAKKIPLQYPFEGK